MSREVALLYNTDHSVIHFESGNFLEQLKRIINCFGQPYEGGIPNWQLYNEIGLLNKVTVNGTGGDELFGNYNRHLRPPSTIIKD